LSADAVPPNRSPEQRAANLLAAAGFEFDSVMPVPHSESNSVYACHGKLAGATIRCYLKVGDRAVHCLANERKALQHVRVYGIRVPTVIAALDRGDPPFLLLSEVRGVMLWDLIDPRRARRATDSALQHLRTYGATLAQIHAIQPSDWVDHPRAELEDVAALESAADDRRRRLVEWLTAHRPARINKTFIHGDFNTANVLIDADAPAGVIDWEFAGLGWKEYELAWALRARLDFLNTPEERDAILSGYSSTGSFGAEQLRWCEVLNYLQFAQWTHATNPAYSEFALAHAENARDAASGQ
jgi:Ser/Thr protein kinase RdoA (MazF antagonist)